MKRERGSECGDCGTEERWLLHNVRHRGSYRRLCTNCLLNSHQGLFCPFCFQVYEESESLPPHQRLMCLKCPSISHLSCLPSSHPHSPPSFICPSCSTPNFSFFTFNNTNTRLIGKDSAKALVAAAKIAAVSMTKAAAVARVEAERRVKEAALAKKRAREALERLAYLAAKENNENEIEMKKERHPSSSQIHHHHRIQGDGKTNAEKGTNGLYSVSPVAANVNAGAGVLQRQQSANSMRK